MVTNLSPLERMDTQKISKFSVLIPIIFTLFFLISQNSFGQPEIPTQFSKFQSDEYGIGIDYPSNWQILGDVEAGDYRTDIAIFAPIEEIKFKEFDSWKDYYKFDYRVVVDLDYSYLLPKLNLNFVLDNQISNLPPSGFKELEIIDSTTKSKLADKPAYKFTYHMKYKGYYLKYLQIVTIIDENQLLFFNFKAPAEYFDLYLPTFQHMIDSFKFGQFENNSTNTESTAVTNTNQQAIKKIFENDE